MLELVEKKTVIVLLMTIFHKYAKKIKQFVKGNYNCDYYFEK
jgi:hypothetical protein